MAEIDSESHGQTYLSQVLKGLVTALKNQPSAWPFKRPVTEEEAPGYFTVVKTVSLPVGC